MSLHFERLCSSMPIIHLQRKKDAAVLTSLLTPTMRRAAFIYEQYDDRAAFDIHTASEHFKWFGDTAGSVDCHKQLDTWELAGLSTKA